MGKYIKLFDSHLAYEDFIESEDFILPNVSRCDSEKDMHYTPYYDYSQLYLTFTAIESGTFSFSNDINYSLDGGSTWSILIAGNNTPTITKGNKILWKAELSASLSTGIGTFSSTDEFEVEGNIMSLLYGNNYENNIALTSDTDQFGRLFYNCIKLTNAKNLILPSTTLKTGCYYEMFRECTSLTTAPYLPAETLVSLCYLRMFYLCLSLNYIKVNFKAGLDASSCTSAWLSGVLSEGTIVFNLSASAGGIVSNSIRDYYGCPLTWTVISSFNVTEYTSPSLVTTPSFWILLYKYRNKDLELSINGNKYYGSVTKGSSSKYSYTYRGSSEDGKTFTINQVFSQNRSGDPEFVSSIQYIPNNSSDYTPGVYLCLYKGYDNE